MPIEMSSDRAVCFRCGIAYGKRKGNFPVSYSNMHKGAGYLPICKTCVEAIYSGYLAQCNDPKKAVRQVCRALDLFWSEKAYAAVEKKGSTRTLISQYLTKVNTNTFASKSYDDTLAAEGTLWSFAPDEASASIPQPERRKDVTADAEDAEDDVPEEVKLFWGSGYTPKMYRELEQRRDYWMSCFPEDEELDVPTEGLIRQICALEVDINRDRAAGKSVDKNVTVLNTLLGSANLRPAQKRQDDTDAALSNTPLGVWLYRYENKRPLPEVDEDLRDVSGIKKYIFTWMGHLCKMLGLKNGYSQLYEEEIARYRVEHPEYDGDDDETMMSEIISESGDAE